MAVYIFIYCPTSVNFVQSFCVEFNRIIDSIADHRDGDQITTTFYVFLECNLLSSEKTPSMPQLLDTTPAADQ